MKQESQLAELRMLEVRAQQLLGCFVESAEPGAKEAAILLCNLMRMFHGEQVDDLIKSGEYTEQFLAEDAEWPAVIGD